MYVTKFVVVVVLKYFATLKFTFKSVIKCNIIMGEANIYNVKHDKSLEFIKGRNRERSKKYYEKNKNNEEFRLKKRAKNKKYYENKKVMKAMLLKDGTFNAYENQKSLMRQV